MSTVLELPPLVANAPGPLHTADELLRLPGGEQYELVDGQLVERDMGALAGWVGNVVATELSLYARQHGGWAFGDGVGYRCYADDPERVRKPDASFIRVDRLEAPPEGFITIPADLVVEVVSPHDIYYEVEAKVDEYLDAGVRLVWVVNPANRSVRVFRSGRQLQEFGSADELTGGEILPGFTCHVRDLFPSTPPAR